MVLVLSGCTLSLDWIQMLRARRAVSSGNYASAVGLLESVRSRNPDGPKALEASRVGARVAQVNAKDFPSAIQFYKHLVLKSESVEERRQAQENVALIYFEQVQDYNQAVYEFEKLMKLELPPAEAFRFRLNLAKSHFELNNLEQATNELETLLSRKLEPDQIFEVKQLKANIHVANKDLAAAAKSWEEMLRDFPDRAKREKVTLNLVVVYEELKDFNKAIETLEKMKADDPNPEFLELRITKLKERQINQPGAQGWKR
jgi:tetratricopeptide (TPR) repeat protein